MLARASNNLAVLDRILCDSDQQLRFWAPSKITLLDRASTFYSDRVLGSHVLRTLHLYFATVLTPSRRPCGWVSSGTLAVSSKAAPDTILPIVQWRCRLQSPRSLAFVSCKFAALYTSIRCRQAQHATSFYIWSSPLCSSCACICMSISLCRYRVLIFFLYFLSSYVYIYIYIYPRGPRFPQGVGWGGVWHVNVIFMVRWWVGWVGWGMLTSCSWYVETLKKNMLQHADEVEATTSKKRVTIHMSRFMLT